MNRRFTLICLSLGVFSIPYFRWVWPILFTAVDPGGIDSIYYNAANVVSLILASALSFSVLVTPGILVKIHRRSDEWMWVPLVGPAFLGLTGLGYWLAPAPLALVLLPALLGGLILVQLCWVLARTIWPERINLTLVSVMVAAIALGVAKSSYSHGPKGELYANSISHTLEPGLRPDSRIGYHVVQMIAHHWSPMERAADRLFAPYHFSSRGPLAGFIVAPLSILAAIDVPVDPPDQSYRTFDPEGFMAFRIAMVVLTVLMTFVPFYCVLRLLSGNYFAVAACANLALMPFTLHEIFFTWPKLSAAGLAIGTFYLLMSGRSFFVGIASAGAYLFHPLALLGLPFSYLAFVCFDKRTGNAQKIAVLLKAAIPFGLIVLGWFALGGFVNHQSGFLNYISTARGESALSVANWMSARWESLLATFLPLYFYHLHGETLLAKIFMDSPLPKFVKYFFAMQRHFRWAWALLRSRSFCSGGRFSFFVFGDPHSWSLDFSYSCS